MGQWCNPTQNFISVLALASSLGCQAHAPDSPGESGLKDSLSESSPNELASSDTDPLPNSFKGYELYAWEEAGALSFTLMTGTNRQKTLAEVTASAANVSTNDWVFVRGEGLEALHGLLERVPAGASVVLMTLDGLGPLSEGTRAKITQALESH